MCVYLDKQETCISIGQVHLIKITIVPSSTVDNDTTTHFDDVKYGLVIIQLPGATRFESILFMQKQLDMAIIGFRVRDFN